MPQKLAWLSLAVAVWLLAGWWPLPGTPGCRLTVLDVGQGDAILIQTPDHQDLLIDGGPSARVVDLLGQHLGPGNPDLELVILTHPDNDHINGLVSVIQRLAVKQVLSGAAATPTEIFSAWRSALAQHQVPIRNVVQGENFSLGDYLDFTVLWPPAGEAWQIGGSGTPTNEASVSIHLTCAGSTAVLTGDASGEVEERIMASGLPVQADLLKIGHHGSRFSTSHEFIRAVEPNLAVISVGAENRYKHPHPATLERLKKAGLKVLRTDQNGDIRLRSTVTGEWEIGP